MASLDDIKKKLSDLFTNAVIGVEHSPVGKGLVNAQHFIDSNKSIDLPQVPNAINPTFKIGIPNSQFQVPVKPVSMVRDIANVPVSWAANTLIDAGKNIGRTISGQPLADYNNLKSPVTKLGYNIGSAINPATQALYHIKNTPQQVLGNAAGSIEGPLSVYSGGKVLGVGKNAAESAAKNTLMAVIKKEAATGAINGGLFGLLNGLSEGKDKSLKDQLVSAGAQGAMGAGTGAVLSGTIGAVGYGLGAARNRLLSALEKHNIKGKEADAAIKQFARDELGRFTNQPAPDFRGLTNDMTPRPAVSLANSKYYSPARGVKLTEAQRIDMRRALNLPEDGNYQAGFIKPSEFFPTSDLSPEEYLIQKAKQLGLSSLDPQEQEALLNSGLSVEALRELYNGAKPGEIKLQEQATGQPFGSTVSPANYTPPDAKQPNLPGQLENPANEAVTVPTQKERGLVTSVKETPSLSAETRISTGGTYTPKPNTQLMGEAQALLSEGASIDFKHTTNLDQKVAATIQQAINLDNAGNHEAAANLFNNLSAHATELGRGVQAFSLLDKMSPEAISLSAAGKIRAYNAVHDAKIPELTGDQQQLISSMVDNIRNMADGREKNIAIGELQKTINNFIPSTLADKFITVWKAGLLTSLRTHERNLLGNTIMQGAEVAKDPFTTAADKLMSLRTGTRTQTTTLQGLNEAVSKDTVQQVTDKIRLGFDPSGDIGKYDIKTINWNVKNPVERFLKGYTDSVFNVLSAEDTPFYNSAFQRSLNDQAGAISINTGQSVKEIMQNPTAEMLTTATTDAAYATFHDPTKLASIANTVKDLLTKSGGIKGEVGKVLGEVVAPFTGVPSSIAGKTIAYSPIGLVNGAVKMGKVLTGSVPQLQRQAAQEVGRGILGTGLFAIGAYLMSKGLMTGQPKDTAEANQWALEGKQANSVLIGGQWRSINSVGPQFLIMLAGAKYQEEMGKPGGGDVAKYLTGLGQDQLSQTFVQGMQGPLNALSDPNRYGSSYLGNTLNSGVPNIVKDTAKAFDPNQRENNKPMDYVTNSIPFLRNQNVVKRDTLGNPMKQEPSGAGAYFDLFNSKTPISNPVVDELSRLNTAGTNATPGKMQKSQTINGVKMTLTPEQLNILESQVGPQAMDALQSLFATPDYQALPDEEKATAISSLMTQIRKQVRGNIDLTNQSPITPQTNSNLQFTLISDMGNVRRIDLSTPIDEPTYTGNTELDKKLKAKYNSELTARTNDIVDLYKAKKIDAKTAESLLQNVLDQKLGTGKKPAKISVKHTAIPKIKIAAFKKSGTKIKSLTSSVKIKAASPKLSTPKASFSYKIARKELKGLQQGRRIV